MTSNLSASGRRSHLNYDDDPIPPSPNEFTLPFIKPNMWNRFTNPAQKNNLRNCVENTHLHILGTTYKVAAIFTSPKPQGTKEGFFFDYLEYQFKVRARDTDKIYCLAPIFS